VIYMRNDRPFAGHPQGPSSTLPDRTGKGCRGAPDRLCGLMQADVYSGSNPLYRETQATGRSSGQRPRARVEAVA
jgi:hypothetical protein